MARIRSEAWTQESPSTSGSYNQLAAFSTSSAPGTGYKVHFIKPDGEKVTVEANEDESLLDVARANDLDVEGACEASLACSTCHLILDEESFNKLEEPSDEENDMLDLAFGLTDTGTTMLDTPSETPSLIVPHRSRLGCQVLMNKELDGLTARMPSATRNMAGIGFFAVLIVITFVFLINSRAGTSFKDA
ncbi:2Fe-2S ferredoxin-type domain-containing protein [Mortierella sp. GBAus27b]|nr:2Fe-2S ferredoxin-type domain-containing protein [Mortierella sp. GBAus27b]